MTFTTVLNPAIQSHNANHVNQLPVNRRGSVQMILLANTEYRDDIAGFDDCFGRFTNQLRPKLVLSRVNRFQITRNPRANADVLNAFECVMDNWLIGVFSVISAH